MMYRDGSPNLASFCGGDKAPMSGNRRGNSRDTRDSLSVASRKIKEYLGTP